MLDGSLALVLLPLAFFALGSIALSASSDTSRSFRALNAAFGALSILAGLILCVRFLVPNALSTGALAFLVIAWTGVLGTMVWAFALILKSQATRDATPDPDDDMTIDQRVPPTAI